MEGDRGPIAGQLVPDPDRPTAVEGKLELADLDGEAVGEFMGDPAVEELEEAVGVAELAGDHLRLAVVDLQPAVPLVGVLAHHPEGGVLPEEVPGEVEAGVREIPPVASDGVVLGLEAGTVLPGRGVGEGAADVRVDVPRLDHPSHVEPETAVGTLEEEALVPAGRHAGGLERGAGLRVREHVGDDAPDLRRPLLGEPLVALGGFEFVHPTLERSVPVLELGEAFRHLLERDPRDLVVLGVAGSTGGGQGSQGGPDRVSHPAHGIPRDLKSTDSSRNIGHTLLDP